MSAARQLGEIVQPRPNWHDRAYLGLHYDFHATATDVGIGARATVEHLREQLVKVRPDFVQCDCRGVNGFASYPTDVGAMAPGLVADQLRAHREVTRELGIPLVVHFCALWDARSVGEHPEWAQRDRAGNPSPRYACVRSSYVHELLIPQMEEIVREYAVDGFWVDADVWCALPCWCERCVDAFVAEAGVDAPTSEDDDAWRGWVDFHRRSYKDYARSYTAAIHAADPNCTVCINWLGTIIDPAPVDFAVDYLSGDLAGSSNEWGICEARFLDGRGLSWDLMCWAFTRMAYGGQAFKSLPQLEQEASIAIASGGAVAYYLVPHRNGRLTGWQHDRLGEAAAFCRQRQAVSHGTTSVAQVGVILFVEDHLRRDPALYQRGASTNAVEGAVLGLLENHFHVDLLDDTSALERMAEYPMVVVAEPETVPPALAEALRGYVLGGGRLLAVGARVAVLLPDLVGAVAEGEPLEGYRWLPLGQEAVPAPGPWQPVQPGPADMLVELLSYNEPGEDVMGIPAVTRHHYGDGVVVSAHGPIFSHFMSSRFPQTRELVGLLCAALAPAVRLEVDAPPRVHASLRRKEGMTAVHLVNLGSDYMISQKNYAFAELPPVPGIVVRLRMDAPPTEVELVPGGAADWTWDGERVSVSLPPLEVHTAVRITGAGPV